MAKKCDWCGVAIIATSISAILMLFLIVLTQIEHAEHANPGGLVTFSEMFIGVGS